MTGGGGLAGGALATVGSAWGLAQAYVQSDAGFFDASFNGRNTDDFLRRDGAEFDASAERLRQLTGLVVEVLSRSAPGKRKELFEHMATRIAVKDLVTVAEIDLCKQVHSVFCENAAETALLARAVRRRPGPAYLLRSRS